MALGKQIKACREYLGWTLQQLSDLSGVEDGTINALENRDSSRSKYARNIANAFGLSVDELENGEMPKLTSSISTALGPAIQTPSVSTPVARLIQRLTEMEAAGQLTPPLLRALETLLEAVAPRRTSQKLLAAQALLSTQQILQGNSPHENPPPDPAQEHTPSAE